MLRANLCITMGLGLLLISNTHVQDKIGKIMPQKAHAQTQSQLTEPLSFESYHNSALEIDIEHHEVTLDKFKKLMKKDNTVILDLRSKESYDQRHIKGAKHLGSDFTAEKLAELIPNKDTNVLLYCNNSLMAVRMIALTHVSGPQLISHGYKNTYMLGNAWQRSDAYEGDFPKGIPTETNIKAD